MSDSPSFSDTTVKEDKVINLAHKDHLKSYVREALKFPLLSAEEESILAKEWHEKGDPKAMEKLLNSHLKLVVRIAKGYKGYGMNMADLIAEGNIGMMQALRRFDVDKGFRFSTYATWWIQAAIKEYIMKNWSLVKIGTTHAQKKLFFSLRQLKNKLLGEETHLSDEHIKEISHHLSVSEKDVKDMNERLNADYSLNTRIAADEDNEWQEWLSDGVESHDITLAHQQELKKRQEILKNALAILPARDKQVLFERRLSEPPKTLEELAQRLSLSRERVRQIEMSSFHKLQKEMHKQVQHLGM